MCKGRHAETAACTSAVLLSACGNPCIPAEACLVGSFIELRDGPTCARVRDAPCLRHLFRHESACRPPEDSPATSSLLGAPEASHGARQGAQEPGTGTDVCSPDFSVGIAARGPRCGGRPADKHESPKQQWACGCCLEPLRLLFMWFPLAGEARLALQPFGAHVHSDRKRLAVSMGTARLACQGRVPDRRSLGEAHRHVPGRTAEHAGLEVSCRLRGDWMAAAWKASGRRAVAHSAGDIQLRIREAVATSELALANRARWEGPTVRIVVDSGPVARPSRGCRCQRPSSGERQSCRRLGECASTLAGAGP